MLDDVIVADATAHGYNWAESNWAVPAAASTTAAGFGLHNLLMVDPDLLLTEAEFKRDWPIEDVAETLFLEGGVDLVCHHGTPIHDFYKDGHSDTEKGFALRDAYPGRALVYGAINPFAGDRWKDDIEDLVERGVDGLKVYAARYDQGLTIEQRLDDPELGYPFIERALELGVRVIATHKAIPFGPVRSAPYGVDDVPEVLSVFPTMQFEIVHSGWAFVEDTAFLAFFPNCWFNLEMCFALIDRQPRRFAEFLAALIGAGAADRILYSSGMAIAHPRPALESFRSFEMPEDLIAGYGLPPLTDELKRGILGENLLRLHGIDPDAFRARIAGDAVSAAQARGLSAPWSHMRARLGATA